MTNNFMPPKTWEELISLKSTLINDPRYIARLSFSGFIYDTYRYLIPKKIQYQRIMHQIGPNPYKLTPNNFPYDLLLKNLPKVRQYCLWSPSGPLSADKVEKIIKTTYSQSRFFWFVNHPKYKSVPEIWHCHVFINGQ